ncbi:MAG: hypothetical protein RIT28_4843, partial [Pseudomonadota bacterium]
EDQKSSLSRLLHDGGDSYTPGERRLNEPRLPQEPGVNERDLGRQAGLPERGGACRA